MMIFNCFRKDRRTAQQAITHLQEAIGILQEAHALVQRASAMAAELQTELDRIGRELVAYQAASMEQDDQTAEITRLATLER